MATRKTLKNKKRAKKILNMERIYQQLDSGRSVKSVAKEWGVGISTLYRRHREYQKELEEKSNPLGNGYPPLPEDLMQTFSHTGRKEPT